MKNNDFRNFLNSVPHGQFTEVRQQIILQCCITPQTFGNWKGGRTQIPAAAKEQIRMIARSYGHRYLDI